MDTDKVECSIQRDLVCKNGCEFELCSIHPHDCEESKNELSKLKEMKRIVIRNWKLA